MNTLKGAAAVFIFGFAWWLLPPDNDPTFMAVPIGLRLFTGFSLVFMMLGAMALFAWGVTDDLRRSDREKAQ